MTADPFYSMSCFRGEFRSDLGKAVDDFLCTCPYDDRLFRTIRSFPGPDRSPWMVCSKSDNGSAPMTCTDKEYLENLTYDIGLEWKRQTKEITLLPCCPEGETCGDSCKTADGVKDVCVQEKKTVQYLTRLPKEK